MLFPWTNTELLGITVRFNILSYSTTLRRNFLLDLELLVSVRSSVESLP